MNTPRFDMEDGAMAGPVAVIVAVIVMLVVMGLLFAYGPRSAHGGELPEGMHLMTEVVKVDTVINPHWTPATDERKRLDSIIAERWNNRE